MGRVDKDNNPYGCREARVGEVELSISIEIEKNMLCHNGKD